MVLTPRLGETTVASLTEQLTNLSEFRSPHIFLYVGGETSAPDELQRRTHVAQEFGLQLVDLPQRLIDQVSLALCCPSASSRNQRGA